jgi:hypothetical protein
MKSLVEHVDPGIRLKIRLIAQTIATPEFLIAIFLFVPILKQGSSQAGIFDPTLIALLIAVGLAVYRFASEPAKSFRLAPIDIFLLLFLTIVWVGIFPNLETGEAVEKAARITGLVVAPYFVTRAVVNSRASIRRFWAGIIVGGAIISIGVVITSFIPDYTLGFRVDGVSTAPRSGFFNANPIPTAGVLTIFIPAILGYVLIANNDKAAAAGGALGVVAIYATYLTGSRGSFVIALFIGIVMLSWWAFRQNRRAGLTLIAILTLLAVLSLSPSPRDEYLRGRFATVINVNRVVSPAETALVSPTDTVIVSPTETALVSPTDTVIVSPADTVVVSPTETALISPTDTVVVKPTPTPNTVTTVSLGSDPSVTGRGKLIRSAMTEFRNSWLFGNGTASQTHAGSYPHNMPVEVAAEFGVIGLTVLVTISSLSLYSLWSMRTYLTDSLTENWVWYASALTIVAAMFALSLLSGPLDSHKSLLVFVALSWNLPKILNSNEDRESTSSSSN